MIEDYHVNKKRKHSKCEQAMLLLSPLCLHRLCLSFNPTNKNPVKWGQETLVANKWHCAADPIWSISETISIRIHIHKTFFFVMISIIIFYNINFSFWIHSYCIITIRIIIIDNIISELFICFKCVFHHFTIFSQKYLEKDQVLSKEYFLSRNWKFIRNTYFPF